MSKSEPVIRGYLEPRRVETPQGVLVCPRPIVRLVLANRMAPNTSEPEFSEFILDTGSDVSLVPIRFARQHRLLGFDEAAEWVAPRTSFQGELHGRWGTLQLRLATAVRSVPCFYFDASAVRASWFDRWVRRTARPVEEPRILGCAGVLGGNLRLTIDGSREVGLYSRG